MSKAVMLSIRPKWCEKIASGEKTIEVRKTRPNLPTPFKAYIYCSQGSDARRLRGSWGKVVGEFTCDRIYGIVRIGFDGGDMRPKYFVRLDKWRYFPADELLPAAQLPREDLDAYLAGGDGYGWHISGLRIYDQPRELSEFTGLRTFKGGFELREIDRPPQSWCYVEAMEDE